MAFGFDPSIILSASKASEGSIGDTLQQLASIRAQRAQEQHAQATLADLMRRQQQEKTLADIYRTTATNPAGRAQALYGGGFGEQARAEEDQAAQRSLRDAESRKAMAAVQDAHRKHVGELFYGADTPEKYAAARQELASNPDPMLAIYAKHLPEQFDPAVAQRLGNLAMSAKERSDVEQKGLDREAANKRAQIMASTRRALASAGVSPDDLTPEALDAMATQYAATGQLPAGLGMGKAASGLRVKIANRASELAPGTDLAGAKAGYAANSKSLAKQQAQSDAMNAFEGTALKNLDTFLETAKSVVDVGSPLFNAPARKFDEKVKGDPKMAAFTTARATAVQEIGKVLSGSLGSAAISDGARHEVEALLKPDASLKQIMAAAKILKQDMANRRKSVEEQIQETKGRISGKAAKEATPAGNGWSDADEKRLQELERLAGGAK